MTKSIDHAVYFTERDGLHLAASITTPLFCISADTFDEVKSRVERAFTFYYDNKDARPVIIERTVSSFSPSCVENYPVREALCA